MRSAPALEAPRKSTSLLWRRPELHEQGDEDEGKKSQAKRPREGQQMKPSNVFSLPLTAYKRKDDLKGVAAALGLSETGTIPQLSARIKKHLEDNPAVASSYRFSGLSRSRRGGKRGHSGSGAASASGPAAQPSVGPDIQTMNDVGGCMNEVIVYNNYKASKLNSLDTETSQVQENNTYSIT
ncbi:hypothetical protein JB92DRAFT_3029835 [Gautieria morchelliformis]|nr:hypothetical protein JB92DRAFT_3029835 [Gautieria morchelliformis]